MVAAIYKKTQLWAYAHLWAWVLVVTASFWRRVRMSHNNGTTASGKVRIVEHPQFPAHDFFVPGREFPCRLRHASVSYMDDTVIQVRAASLKFADSLYESPLDLEMNTGTISLFWTARNFLEFAATRDMVDGLAFRPYYDKNPRGVVAAKSGIRKYPASFAGLYYHSQCAQLFQGQDGVKRYVKFRLVPGDRGPETGLLSTAELSGWWSEEVAPGETRSPNYLKTEFAERLGRAKVVYHLELQLHTPAPDDSPELLNCNVQWDEKTHPYLPLATVELATLRSFDENNLMRFSVAHCPPSLDLLPAASVDDYNSVNYMRAKSAVAKRLRLAFYKLFGMPKPVPNERTDHGVP